jgi:hypothetical protein
MQGARWSPAFRVHFTYCMSNPTMRVEALRGFDLFRNASSDGGEMTLWVDSVEKGLVIFGEQ